jgi:hypothetical protein
VVTRGGVRWEVRERGVWVCLWACVGVGVWVGVRSE